MGQLIPLPTFWGMFMEYVLEMRDICKSFPGVKALDNAQLRLKSGTVHALMGENGAGKSTLMKCLFGIYYRDSGDIILDGKSVAFKNPKDAMEHGVAMVHQELNQVLKRNVMDNIWLGRFPTRFGLVNEVEMRRRTEELFQDLEIEMDCNAILSTMSVAKRQMLEIAKAVSYNAKVLVLDEPTSSLTKPEVYHLFKIINKLRDRGCAIVYISHKMEEILAISDEVTIMRDGKYISTDSANDLTTNAIIKKMVGRELTNVYPPKTNVVGDELLRVEHLTAKYQPSVQDVSFTLHKGEILGIAGLVGSRRTEILENLFGIATKETGDIYLKGKRVDNSTPLKALKNGFAMITEERRASGIFDKLTILENATMANLNEYQNKIGLLSKQNMVSDSQWVVDAMHVKTPSLSTPIKSLSGGNQQKVIIGRWLLTKPDVLLLDEPTRGIDVGAKYEIYELIIKMASEGKGIIMVSSEMPELMGVCDRILVMSNGKLAGEVNGITCNQEEIMTLAAKYV